MSEFNQQLGENVEDEIISTGGLATGSPFKKPKPNYKTWFESLDDEGKYNAIENETYYAEMLEKNLVQ